MSGSLAKSLFCFCDRVHRYTIAKRDELVMRIFEEGKSIVEVVDKAWKNAGMPKTFEVEVLEQAEFGFFGICKKPYKISFSYSLEAPASKHKQPGHVSKDNNSGDSEQKTKERSHSSATSSREGFSNRRHDSRDRNNRNENNRDNRGPRPARNARSFATKDSLDSSNSSSHVAVEHTPDVEPDNWNADLVIKAVNKLTEIFGILHENLFELNYAFEKNVLTINLLWKNDFEMERSFYVSIAPLLVQMIKKETGLSLRGLRIIINCEKI